MHNNSWPDQMQQLQAQAHHQWWQQHCSYFQTTSPQDQQIQHLLQHRGLEQQHQRQHSSHVPDNSRYYAHNSLQQTHPHQLGDSNVGPSPKRIKCEKVLQHHQRKAIAKYWMMKSVIEFCPEGSLEFSWSVSGATNATLNVQEATGRQECTIGLVLYELTEIDIKQSEGTK